MEGMKLSFKSSGAANLRLEEPNCVVDLATSECFSNEKKKDFLAYLNPHVNYDIAPHLCADDILLTLRAWIYGCAVQNVDNWRLAKATKKGEWTRVPCFEEISPAPQRAEGLERRYVPVAHQMLPGVTRHGGVIPESRPGWPDNHMNHDKGASMTPGFYTHIDLDKDHFWLGSWSDSLGDADGYFFVFETTVNPRATSTDQLEGSKGSVFYQEAVHVSALLVRCMPITSNVGTGIRTGVMPPLLFAQRYVLTHVQLNQRAARPPADNAFHPSHRSATDIG
jgi:hypothetical protein